MSPQKPLSPSLDSYHFSPQEPWAASSLVSAPRPCPSILSEPSAQRGLSPSPGACPIFAPQPLDCSPSSHHFCSGLIPALASLPVRAPPFRALSSSNGTPRIIPCLSPGAEGKLLGHRDPMYWFLLSPSISPGIARGWRRYHRTD